jgi:ubiquinol-cytochrome c reductase cytochrome b subunit
MLAVSLWTDSCLHADNFMEAERMTTPAHITPEWYFLPFYALLRAVDSKLLGVGFLVLAVLQFALMC